MSTNTATRDSFPIALSRHQSINPSAMMTSTVQTQQIGDLTMKPKGGIFNCLDDILMANESSIVLPVRDLAQMHPMVRVEPQIEIKLELSDSVGVRSPPPAAERLIESLLQVPSSATQQEMSNGGGGNNNSNKIRSKSHSASPHSNCSNESATTRRHHHRHHVTTTTTKHRDISNNAETNKENVPAVKEAAVSEVLITAEDEHHHRHRHHHRHHHAHTHRHHNHTTAGTAAAGVVSTTVADGSSVQPRPDQVLRKYIIKKITIRKQDGSTKKIVIKKAVDEPNGPVKLTKVWLHKGVCVPL